MGDSFGSLNRDMGEGTSSVDRISELPDFILHQILSYLSTKEAAQTGLISKRWQYVCKTFPILDCHEWFFGRELDILNPKELGMPKDERRKIFNQRVKFMSYVDEKLQRFHEENLCVKKFLLHITLVSNNLASRVDSWMELVTDLRVQELDIYLTVGRERFYVLPMKVLAMESLTILNLRGCLLSSSFNRDTFKFSSLIELHLRDVFIDEATIQDLIYSIHSLEVLTLKNCLGFEKLEIYDHDTLRKLVYHPHKGVKAKKLSVKVLNLEELDFCSVDKDKTASEIIIDSACRNLKRLSLSGIPIDAKWLQSTISSFPLLEHLFLGGCVLQVVMKLSSPVLKEGEEMPFNAEEYNGIQFPPLELNSMKLVTHTWTSANYVALSDGLFWSLRPEILSLELNYYSPEFLKGMLKSLVVEEEPNRCCSQKNIKCWRHSLKDVKLINVKGFESNTLLDSKTLSNLTNFLDDWAIDAQRTVKSYGVLTGETLSFRFSW
ncbi:F-box/FBD/LRR-repeat protein At5g56420 isoform X2 [Beta vulgaris subsp. vulgaris]|uniref:F-box/FBD/LRR-repeat protein At5g56420 isoform X2 n=1 Tax=Beta vulgaris subsp. vulgaris TaxID=3555 RepID=UPI002036B3E3|nr:F-box/FBD/LRR-repeat protein At5g56420 isoform X2 [Beta vulgaris subsp. vulgaris]